jgi:hypothetical protein
MPWTGKSFKAKHNHSLTSGEAKKAARQATAMVGAGVPEGIAIATANKHINRLRSRGAISERSRSKMSAGLDRDPDVNAATR